MDLVFKPPALSRAWWFGVTAICLHLLLMMDLTQASRLLQQDSAPQPKRLRAYRDSSDTPMHGPPIQSFLVSDGSWVDCVPIEQQIAAHHPALKDHIIQMPPPSPPGMELGMNPQHFAREHGGCPGGSIPVQRRDPNVEPLFKKTQARGRNTLDTTGSTKSPNPDATDGPHQYATTGTPGGGNYGGAGAILSVNDPVIADPTSEMSLSQLWIIAGSYSDSTLSTVEVGWQVLPSQYPDQPLAPHLFVFWTADAYNRTGCYNLRCAGFVQTNNIWVLGGTMPSYTTLAENANFEAEVSIQVIYDSTQSAWQLYIQGQNIGYWPSSLYTLLQGSAAQVQWGGEIAPAANSVGHTKTAMGSGAFPTDGYWPVAAYQRKLTVADISGNIFDANITDLIAQQYATNPSCYNIAVETVTQSDWGSNFFFGGPGGNNPSCV